MERFEQNGRYLAWLEWPHDSWEVRRQKLSLAWAELRTPSTETALRLAQRFDHDPDDLLNRDLLQENSVNILGENLRQYFKGQKRGYLSEIARALNLNRTTVLRWASGDALPSEKHLLRLTALLSLPTDFATHPYFLTEVPLTHTERLNQLKALLDTLPPRQLQAYYPALCQLLGARSDHGL